MNQQFSLVSLFNASAALVFYGGWAVFANFEHGQIAWLKAGLVQGVYAFVSTLTVTTVAYWMYLKTGCGRKGIGFGLALSYLIMLLIPFSVHSVAATPDRIETVLPGLIIGAVYLAVFLLITEKSRIKQRVTTQQTPPFTGAI